MSRFYFAIYTMLVFSSLLNQVEAKDGIFFKSQGYEIGVDPEFENRSVSRLMFRVDCGYYGNCQTNEFQTKLLEDFAAALKYRRFYKYVERWYDPCFQVHENCIPHDVNPGVSSSDKLNEDYADIQSGNRRPQPEPTHPGFFTKLWDSVATAVGSTVVAEVADYFKSESVRDKNGMPIYVVIGPTTSNGQSKPSSMCRVTVNLCEPVDEVQFEHLNGDTMLVTYPHGNGHGEYRERENQLEKLFERLEYQCHFVYTGVLPNLTAQVTCYYRP
ncbi:hypothetical protein PRUB_a4307 [Pseudoalteromonas rubra]|uniref:Uncharacterized protein n=1 Tax=Pseudoalteromonas rubra TaxID=43658 RepID=A0A8T0C4P4_9GAMM|nr:hypothetical protein [Pseudoalteromonas rubra]KAF7785603.1 hypothetical protein PRUB_a4307 [Pseudoalteromonas rubra]